MAGKDLKTELHGAQLRATGPRLAVLNLLRKASNPLSHREIALALEDEAWSRATLYRNLIDLERAGLIRRTQLGEPIWRFEDATKEHGVRSHPHFLCSSCGIRVCLPDIEVGVGRVKGIGHALAHRSFEIQLRGHCDTCHEGGFR